MKIVFTSRTGEWHPGAVVDFPDKEARQLVEAGRANYWKATQPKSPKPAPPVPAPVVQDSFLGMRRRPVTTEEQEAD